MALFSVKPRLKPIDFITARLARSARRLATGAMSLAHLLVVVPTAQSARRLRLSLARYFADGVLPPVMRLPSQLLDAVNDAEDIATRADEIVAFMEALGSAAAMEMAAMYSELRAMLGANALSFSEVCEYVREHLTGEFVDEELARWERLAEVERAYLAALARRGKRDRIEAVKAALASARAKEGIEKIVVAGVLEPIPVMKKALAALALPVEEIGFDELAVGGELALKDIEVYATPAAEAERLAERFAAVGSDEAWPAVAVVDSALFPDVQSAFKAKGVTLVNPSHLPLATSALGRLVVQLVELLRTQSYAVFSAFVRTGDVRRWLMTELGFSVEDMSAALLELDRRQAELLPEHIGDIAPKTHGKLRAIFEYVTAQLRKQGVRELLKAIFSSRILDERRSDAREFAAAAEAVNRLLDECFAAGKTEAIRHDLFALRLKEADYALESNEGEAAVANGWLEIPYLDEEELYIAGFQEGVVPESVVGHPFLPDSLRRALGLIDNESRARRDRLILRLAVATRAEGAVKVSLHSIDAAGDVQKPSRLLFDTADDRDLIARVRALYSRQSGTALLRAFSVPEAWRLALPIPPPYSRLERSSPTRIDAYLRCPFNYYLTDSRILGDKRVDYRAEELASWEFGNLAHSALERWAQSALKESEDAAAIAEFLAREVEALLAERFGMAIPSIVALQGESVKQRLRHFAPVQAARHREGWRVVTAEKQLAVSYEHTRFNGKCDRIDYNAKTGEWCVIDYKTWDELDTDKNQMRDAKSSGWRKLQLAFYCAMLDALNEPPFDAAKRDRIQATYCVLGKTSEQVGFAPPFTGAELPEAEAEIRRLRSRIEAGIFWPPSDTGEWRFNYDDWLKPDPRVSVSAEWIADQERRLSAFEAKSSLEAANA